MGPLRHSRWGPRRTSTRIAAENHSWPMPRNGQDLADQARGAILRGVADGIMCQRVVWDLPVQRRSYRIQLDGDGSRIPAASTKEEFYAAVTVAGAVLGRGGRGSGVRKQRMDEGLDSEPVALLTATNPSLRMLKGARAMVYPTAETVPFIQEVFEQDLSRPFLIINPQWGLTKNILDDFGFGANRRRAEEFVSSFVTTHWLSETLVGNPRSVDPRVARRSGAVWILRCYPGQWQVFAPPSVNPGEEKEEHASGRNDGPELIAVFEHQPSHKELERVFSQRSNRKSKRQKRADHVTQQDRLSLSRLHQLREGGTWFPRVEIERMQGEMLDAALRHFGQEPPRSMADTGKRELLEEAMSRVQGRLIDEELSESGDEWLFAPRCRLCSGQARLPSPLFPFLACWACVLTVMNLNHPSIRGGGPARCAGRWIGTISRARCAAGGCTSFARRAAEGRCSLFEPRTSLWSGAAPPSRDGAPQRSARLALRSDCTWLVRAMGCDVSSGQVSGDLNSAHLRSGEAEWMPLPFLMFLLFFGVERKGEETGRRGVRVLWCYGTTRTACGARL